MEEDLENIEETPEEVVRTAGGLRVKSLMGRPSNYDEWFNNPDEEITKRNWELMRRACVAGCTDTQMATIFGTSRETIWRWRHTHEDFAEFIKEHKKTSNRKVVEALYERATGYTATINKAMVVKGEILIVETQEHYPPDIKAAEIILYNREPEEWKKRTELNIKQNSIELPGGFDLTKLTTEEVKMLVSISQKASVENNQKSLPL